MGQLLLLLAVAGLAVAGWSAWQQHQANQRIFERIRGRKRTVPVPGLQHDEVALCYDDGSHLEPYKIADYRKALIHLASRGFVVLDYSGPVNWLGFRYRATEEGKKIDLGKLVIETIGELHGV